MINCDLLVIIPMQEEFEGIKETFKGTWERLTDGELKGINCYHQKHDSSGMNIISIILPKIGNTNAAVITEKALTHIEPKIAVLFGIAGSLSNDMNLGDVIVPDEVVDYMYAAKIEGDHDPNAKFAPTNYKTSFEFTNFVNGFKNEPEYVNWLKDVQTLIDTKFSNDKNKMTLPKPPSVKPIASGDIVIASKYVKDILNNMNRYFSAVEMEAAGFLCSARTRNVRTMVIRGISDYADQEKKKTDTDNINWRSYATNTAALFLKNLLDSKTFVALLKDSFQQTHDLRNSIYQMEEISYELELGENDEVRHTSTHHIKNISVKPRKKYRIWTYGDVPKTWEEINPEIFIYDEPNWVKIHDQKIKPEFHRETPTEKVFFVKFDPPLYENCEKRIKMIYNWPEPLRYYQYDNTNKTKKIKFAISFPADKHYSLNVYEMIESTGEKKPVNIPYKKQTADGKITYRWEKVNPITHPIRFEWS